jgi:hypothetical protein
MAWRVPIEGGEEGASLSRGLSLSRFELEGVSGKGFSNRANEI